MVINSDGNLILDTVAGIRQLVFRFGYFETNESDDFAARLRRKTST